MHGTLALVLAGGEGTRLHPLTTDTPKPVLPFAGIFRIIDFAFSNCVHSGIPRILFVTRRYDDPVQRYVERLLRTLPPGWPGAVLVEPSCATGTENTGTADAVYRQLPLLRRMNPASVLVLASDHVYRMEYRPLMEAHREGGTDVTVGAVEVPLAEAPSYGVLESDAVGQVVSFVEKPTRPAPVPDRPGNALVSMGIYVFGLPTLEAALIDDSLDPFSTHDFGRDVIPRLVAGRRVRAYRFSDYWRDVGTLDSYFAAHRELLLTQARLKIEDPGWPTLSAAWRMLPGGLCANRHGSLLSPGCLCDAGARILGSFISPAVRVGRGAVLEECVVLDGARIGAGVRLRRTIVAPGAQLPAGTVAGHDPVEDRRRFVVSPGGIVAIPSGLIP